MEYVPYFTYGALLLASALMWRNVVPGWRRAHDVAAAAPRAWSVIATIATAGWVAHQLRHALTSRTLEGTPQATLENVKVSCAVGAVVWVVLLTAVCNADPSRLALFGIHARGIGRQIRVGLSAFVVAMLPVFLVQLLTYPLRTPDVQHPMLKLLEAEGGQINFLWIALAAVVIAPLSEELMYRVILQRALAAWLPATAAVIGSSLLFSVIHGWPDMLPLFPLALVLGSLYRVEDSYVACVVAHAAFNGWMLLHTLILA